MQLSQQIRQNNKLSLQLPLLLDGLDIVVRYRAYIHKKTCRQRKIERFNRLKEMVTDDWRSAEELAAVTGIQHYTAVKLLMMMVEDGYVITKSINWIDHRSRHRTRHLYKRSDYLKHDYNGERAECLSLLSCVFGARPPNINGVKYRTIEHHIGDE